MKQVKAVIERASDGTFSIYMDADDMSYLVTGTGSTVEEARKVFNDGYEDMKQYYAFAFSLAGLERITGINQKQLGHYVSGYRNPSPKTKKKIEESIRKFSEELSAVSFA